MTPGEMLERIETLAGLDCEKYDRYLDPNACLGQVLDMCVSCRARFYVKFVTPVIEAAFNVVEDIHPGEEE